MKLHPVNAVLCFTSNSIHPVFILTPQDIYTVVQMSWRISILDLSPEFKSFLCCLCCLCCFSPCWFLTPTASNWKLQIWFIITMLWRVSVQSLRSAVSSCCHETELEGLYADNVFIKNSVWNWKKIQRLTELYWIWKV